jgi:hypothetical protein
MNFLAIFSLQKKRESMFFMVNVGASIINHPAGRLLCPQIAGSGRLRRKATGGNGYEMIIINCRNSITLLLHKKTNKKTQTVDFINQSGRIDIVANT